ncbi:Soluble aldose sugar dehydrogenase, PQQ-dependent [Klebsiella pneumoniae]|uniref:Soluble aldose sugar dehydrogenase, PQQ-dependent n=1 Tax=Klebsiella pneumoniae TaxID=573 RepID=A0A3S4HFL2_KLEPN|nr:Soluble aldose sugar dehydrogenase, PQQ-dependent [Klebsiella pneumoniae]
MAERSMARAAEMKLIFRRRGKNYGWPLATHGINYSGLPIPEAKGKTVPGTEPPLYVWPVSPGVSGMAFYSAPTFPQWQHKAVYRRAEGDIADCPGGGR